jgi:hypothetical protein
MKLEEVAMIAIELAIGVVVGFVAFTYVAPMLTGASTPTT